MIRITDKTIYRAIQIALVVAYFYIGYISYQYSSYDLETDKGNFATIILILWLMLSIGAAIIIFLNSFECLCDFMWRLSKGHVGIEITIPLWRQNTKQIDKLYEELGRASVDGNEALSDEIFKKIQSLEKWD